MWYAASIQNLKVTFRSVSLPKSDVMVIPPPSGWLRFTDATSNAGGAPAPD